jgi:nucleotide-binding universal stress UspA family protein
MLNRIAGWVAEEHARVKAAIDAAVEKLRRAGLRTSVVMKEEEPKALLLNEAESWNADCVFVGARGMRRVERLLTGGVSSPRAPTVRSKSRTVFKPDRLNPAYQSNRRKSVIHSSPIVAAEERVMKIEDILIPLDFSPGSLRALDYALTMVDPGGEVYLLHVVDADFLGRVSEEGFCDAETARAQLRRKAEEQLQDIARKFSSLNVRIESMVVVGKPFAEILRIAADLHFGLIVMGIRGRHQGGIEEILFGSTAEKVLRAARIPVVCVPPGTVAEANK